MIRHQLALIKREIWEHRSIFVTPLAIASIVTLGSLAALIFASGYAEELHMAIFGATNIVGDSGRTAVLTGHFVGTSWLFLVALAILTVFYSLDSLYAERKDKSILFWRSLPVTDAETVISKLITAVVVIPIVAVITIVATHIVNLIVTSIWVSAKGGDAFLLIWGSVALLDNWLAVLIVVLATAIWMSPFIGWFLLVSAFAKRSPLPMAFLPLVLIPLLEGIFLHSRFFATAVFGRGTSMPLFHGINMDAIFDKSHQLQVNEEVISLLLYLDVGQFVLSPATWAGVVVCGLLTTGAIYIRRFRGES